jgi:hypothetical protein
MMDISPRNWTKRTTLHKVYSPEDRITWRTAALAANVQFSPSLF